MLFSTQEIFFLSTTRFSPQNMTLKDRIKRRFRILTILLRLKLGWYGKTDGAAFRIGRMLVKTSSRVRVTEALTTEFVRTNTSIPVPRIIDVFKLSNKTYIVMEFIENAHSLFDVWSDMTDDQKESICAQLKGYINELRSLVAPNPGRVESIDGSPCFDGRLHGAFGPFSSVERFHAHLGHDFVRANPERFEYCQEAFKRCEGKKYRTVFSHCDLGPYNILVRDGKIAAIIDWEFGGCYPEYWEYCQLFLSNLRFPDIQELVKSGAVTELYDDEHRVEGYLGGIFTRC